MSERDQGEPAGTGPGHRRPSRHMRERAEEMADLLAVAAPAVRQRRRRRSAAIPAAVMALGALTVGGVGVAVSLEAAPGGPDTALALPTGPDGSGGTDAPVRVTTSAVTDVPVPEDGDGGDDDRAEPDGDARSATDRGRDTAERVRVPAAGSDRPARAPRRVDAATPTGTSAGVDDVDPREATSSRTPSTTSVRPTDTSSDEPDSPDSPDPGADDRGRSGDDGPDRAGDLRADRRGGAVLRSASPTGDGE